MDPLELDVFVAKLPCACSPGGVDRRTEAFNRILIDLKNERGGNLVFNIHALNLHFQRFKNNPAMARILQEEGHDALPVVFVGGEPVFKRVFPGREELEQAIEKAGAGAS